MYVMQRLARYNDNVKNTRIAPCRGVALFSRLGKSISTLSSKYTADENSLCSRSYPTSSNHLVD